MAWRSSWRGCDKDGGYSLDRGHLARFLERMHSMDAILNALQLAFPDDEFEPRHVPFDETFITLPANHLHAAVEILVAQFDLHHLSTITGQDTGDAIELLYHFWWGKGLTLRTALPYASLSIATVTDVIVGAAFYEREIMEMLGVTFEGHPEPKPLFLPDDWAGGEPLRKTFVPLAEPESPGKEPVE